MRLHLTTRPASLALLACLLAVAGCSTLTTLATAIGVSPADAIRYETALRADQFVLSVHGSVEDAARAQRVLADVPGWQAN